MRILSNYLITLNVIGIVPTYSVLSSSETELKRQFFNHLMAISSSFESALRKGTTFTTAPSGRMANSSSTVIFTDVSTAGWDGLNMTLLFPAVPFIPTVPLGAASAPFPPGIPILAFFASLIGVALGIGASRSEPL